MYAETKASCVQFGLAKCVVLEKWQQNLMCHMSEFGSKTFGRFGKVSQAVTEVGWSSRCGEPIEIGGSQLAMPKYFSGTLVRVDPLIYVFIARCDKHD